MAGFSRIWENACSHFPFLSFVWLILTKFDSQRVVHAESTFCLRNLTEICESDLAFDVEEKTNEYLSIEHELCQKRGIPPVFGLKKRLTRSVGRDMKKVQIQLCGVSKTNWQEEDGCCPGMFPPSDEQTKLRSRTVSLVWLSFHADSNVVIW